MGGTVIWLCVLVRRWLLRPRHRAQDAVLGDIALALHARRNGNAAIRSVATSSPFRLLFQALPNSAAPYCHVPGGSMNLRTPGPTPLPMTVREVLSRDMINHRSPEFAAMLKECTESL